MHTPLRDISAENGLDALVAAAGSTPGPRPHSVVSQVALAAVPCAVALARQHTVDVLMLWKVPGDVVEAARLAVSELTTNAICHHPESWTEPVEANLSPPTVTLTLLRDGEDVVIMLHDHDRHPPRMREPKLSDEGGRGLFLVGCVSKRWGHYLTPNGQGKVIWAEWSVPAPADVTAGDSSYEEEKIHDGRGRTSEHG
ncbi:ATP-binding protein [Streptomyces sp. ISID311]|uniref:ATP-binding protein n=1 Tax=Streptomyces sp. ISID311 TaxID=2601673 RepID=UPI0011BD32FF|nr:ATP-binding protein [Streptomyces sp. ISID311]TXC99852.1 ATP-binding protein [Streptomyces sp. ISID311]